MTDEVATVIRTLALFDLFDYSPTVFEVWRYQVQPARLYSFAEVRAALVAAGNRVIFAHNTWGLAGRDLGARAVERRRRGIYAIRKQKRLVKFVRFWGRYVAGVEALALCNTRLPFHYAGQNSDIDVCVFARSRALWRVRFLLLLPLKLMRQRPGERAGDALDLSMFIGTDNMDLSELTDENPLYLALWCATLEVVCGKENILAKLFVANPWLRTYLPAAEPVKRAESQRVKGVWPLLWLPVAPLRKWQEKHLTPVISRRANQSTAVVLNDHLLKFHVNDRRQEFAKTYQDICQQFGVNV